MSNHTIHRQSDLTLQPTLDNLAASSSSLVDTEISKCKHFSCKACDKFKFLHAKAVTDWLSSSIP